jgi:hypothetical protein
VCNWLPAPPPLSTPPWCTVHSNATGQAQQQGRHQCLCPCGGRPACADAWHVGCATRTLYCLHAVALVSALQLKACAACCCWCFCCCRTCTACLPPSPALARAMADNTRRLEDSGPGLHPTVWELGCCLKGGNRIASALALRLRTPETSEGPRTCSKYTCSTHAHIHCRGKALTLYYQTESNKRRIICHRRCASWLHNQPRTYACTTALHQLVSCGPTGWLLPDQRGPSTHTAPTFVPAERACPRLSKCAAMPAGLLV